MKEQQNSTRHRQMKERINSKEYKKVPPDGGWGWIIVIASALNGISTIAIMQGFGLIFKDTFRLYGFSATDGTIIINTNLAFGMLLGLVNGPLLRAYGYRKVAIVGSLLYTIGVILTTFVKSFPLIMLSYGILAALGLGVTMSAFSFALNSYFTTKRGRATGLALTITGLGPILMPHVTSFLLSFYGSQGTMLLYGSFTLHSLIGSLLLQPVKWHLKEVESTEEELYFDNKLKNNESNEEQKCTVSARSRKSSYADGSRFKTKRRITISSIDPDLEVGHIYGFETSLSRQLSETAAQGYSWNRNHDVYMDAEDSDTLSNNSCKDAEDDRSWCTAGKSIRSVNLGSSMKIFEEYQPDISSRYYSFEDLTKKNRVCRQGSRDQPLLEKLPTHITMLSGDDADKGTWKRRLITVLKRIVDFYDLTLLCDPIYVNMMIGMSVAIFAEVNFSLLLPFILADMDLTTTRIATTMSLVACVDLVSRSIAPYLGEWMKQPPRVMYLLSLILLIISRMCLIFAYDFTSILLVAATLGGAKGIRSVYMALVIPSYVPIERLPYASGIQMMINGVIVISAGPVLGVIRDRTGSYVPCIILMNCVTAFTVTFWLCEIFIVPKMKLRMHPRKQVETCLQKT